MLQHDLERKTIEEAAAGDRSAFRSLVLAHQSDVRGLLLRLTAFDSARADDIAQEVFLSVFDRLTRFRFESSLKSWIYRIAYNAFLDDQRRKTRRIEDPIEADIAWAPNADQKIDVQRILDLALATLKPDERGAVVLTLIEEFTHEDTAQTMGLPIGTVKSHILRGKEKIRDVFRAHHLEVSP